MVERPGMPSLAERRASESFPFGKRSVATHGRESAKPGPESDANVTVCGKCIIVAFAKCVLGHGWVAGNAHGMGYSHGNETFKSEAGHIYGRRYHETRDCPCRCPVIWHHGRRARGYRGTVQSLRWANTRLDGA